MIEMTPHQIMMWQFAELLMRRQTYEGTVPHAVVQRRRTANKVARRSRRINRRRA